jgi:SagB-type dehydrogenase family enzyme
MTYLLNPQPADDNEPDGVIPELEELLSELTEREQRVVHGLLSRARQRMPLLEELDELGIVHGALKADALAVTHRELEATRAPAPFKLYPSAATIALPEVPMPKTLPTPEKHPGMEHTLDRVLLARASRRDFSETPLTLEQLGTLLHYGFGIRKHTRAYLTRDFPMRYAPSAGGLQSNELYLVVNSVDGVPQGLYHYRPDGHRLERLDTGNFRRRMVLFCQRQEWLQYAGAVFILTGVPGRLQWKYGTRTHSYLHMDAGFIGENLYLTATALGLRTTALAGFSEDAVNDLLRIDGHEEFTILLLPVGTKPGSVPAAADDGAEEDGR